MNDLNEKRIAASLRRIIATASTPEKVRRACTLRQSRLRSATTGSRTASTRPTTTARTTAPIRSAAPATPTEAAKFEAFQAFMTLSAQRSALFRKRRTGPEQCIFVTMAALMPDMTPTTDDPAAWRNFIDRIDLILSEIKNIKPL